jgi:hypothetical protein
MNIETKEFEKVMSETGILSARIKKADYTDWLLDSRPTPTRGQALRGYDIKKWARLDSNHQAQSSGQLLE